MPLEPPAVIRVYRYGALTPSDIAAAVIGHAHMQAQLSEHLTAINSEARPTRGNERRSWHC
jgi:hypothetical protein